MICPQCHSENREGAKYCDECGTPLIDLAAKEKAESDSSAPADEPASESPGASECEKPEEAADATNVMVSVGSDETAELGRAEERSSGSETSGLDELGVTGEIWSPHATMDLPLVADPNMPQKSGYRAPEGGVKKRRRPGLIAAVSIVVLLVVAGAAVAVAYALEMWGGKSVPDVVGMTWADAVFTLENRGFAVQTVETLSDETEGLVLLSDPVAGGRAEAGSEVVIHVAVARTVPVVVGGSQADAQVALAASGYTRVSVVTEKSNEAEGTVLAVSPEEGTKASASTEITLTVAEPYYVPDVVGMLQADAQATLEAAGYVVVVARVYTEQYADGSVISTDPVAGSQLDAGSTVTVSLAVSRAAELVSATYDIIYPGQNLTVDDVNYTVSSLDAVAYAGGNTVSYTFTGTPYTYFLGVRMGLDEMQVSGTITFNASNEVTGGNPSFAVAD